MINVIVVEDNPYLNAIICDRLSEASDIAVTGSADSGEKTIQRVSDSICDVILMDIEMGTPTAGIHAAEMIHRLYPKIKIIYLTAHEDSELIIAGMGKGAVDYVVKNGSLEDLEERIRQAYSGEVRLDSNVQKVLLDEFGRLQSSEHSMLFFLELYSRLTPTERDLIRLMLKGLKAKEMARVRCVSELTIKAQIKSLLHKTGCARSRQVVELIHEYNLNHLFI